MRTEEEIRQRVTKLVNAEPVYKYDEEKEAFSHVSEGPRCRKQELKTLLWVLEEDYPFLFGGEHEGETFRGD